MAGEEQKVGTENLVSLTDFRQRRQAQYDLSRGRRPLYLSHMAQGTASREESEGDFAERVARIRKSLERINELMAQLRRSST